MNYEWLAVAMFVGFFFIMMSGYPVVFSFAGAAIPSALSALPSTRLIQPVASAAQPLVRHHVRLHAVGDPYFIFSGGDPGEIRLERVAGNARVGLPGPWRHGDGSSHRRYAAGGDDGRRGSHRHYDGHDVAARYAALWLQQSVWLPVSSCVRHAGATDPAQPRAHRPQRPDRRLRRRSLPWVLHPRPDPGGSYVTYVGFIAVTKPKAAPASRQRFVSRRRIWACATMKAVVPPIVLIFLLFWQHLLWHRHAHWRPAPWAASVRVSRLRSTASSRGRTSSGGQLRRPHQRPGDDDRHCVEHVHRRL